MMTGEMGTSGDSPAGHLHATEKLSGAASRHLVVPGWACGVSGAASRQLVAPHRRGTRLGVWLRPPAQADALARGKPGHRCCVPLLSLGAHPEQSRL